MANRQKVNLVGRFYNESCILLNYLRMTPQEHFVLFFVFVFFVLLAAPKKKQTERTLAGTPQQLWPITAGPDTNKKRKKY